MGWLSMRKEKVVLISIVGQSERYLRGLVKYLFIDDLIPDYLPEVGFERERRESLYSGPK